MTGRNSSDHRWQSLGQPEPRLLPDARRQLHWALQAVSSVGKALLPPAPDDSHQALEWLPNQACLAQALVAAETPFRPALSPAAGSALFLSESGETLASFSLGGQTLQQLGEWLASQAEGFLGAPLPSPLPPPAEIEAHPVSTGQPFSTDQGQAFAELGRFFANAHSLLTRQIQPKAQASIVRTWPHHFDIASLMTLDPGADAETARSIGIGMTPGDGDYVKPYFYVTPWPYPQGSELPSLPTGAHWHSEGWTGAILPANQLVKAGDAEAQEALAISFLKSAVEGCLELLESRVP